MMCSVMVTNRVTTCTMMLKAMVKIFMRPYLRTQMKGEAQIGLNNLNFHADSFEVLQVT